MPGATAYPLEMSADAQFTNPTLFSQGGLSDTVFRMRGAMILDTTVAYYRRVTAGNECDTG